VRSRLHKNKIFLLGHSFGSILGVDMVQRRPDLFYAYVGTGQVSDMPRSQKIAYEQMVERARATGDLPKVKELEQLGAPPFGTFQKATTYFKMLASYAPDDDRDAEPTIGRLLSVAPNYSLWDIYNRLQGFARIPSWELYSAMLSTNLAATGVHFDMPVFFFEGTEDTTTPASLAKEYFDKIDAPRKEFVPLDGGGHFAVWTMSERFGRELATRVRPIAPMSRD
jgi:pimeloyl-ACP methyl ester carboxylesterase